MSTTLFNQYLEDTGQGVSVRLWNFLFNREGEGIFIQELQGMSDDELMQFRGIGRKSLNEFRRLASAPLKAYRLPSMGHSLPESSGYGYGA